MKNNLRRKNTESGFGVPEVMVSIFIISVGIVTIINMFAGLQRNETANKRRLIAAYLAEESIEIVRQLRDNNWFSSNLWDQGIYNSGNDRIITVSNCGSGACALGMADRAADSNDIVYIKDGAGGAADRYYGQTNGAIPAGWTATPFRRWLTVEKEDYSNNADNDYLKIISYVSYNGQILIEVTAYLNNWR